MRRAAAAGTGRSRGESHLGNEEEGRAAGNQKFRIKQHERRKRVGEKRQKRREKKHLPITRITTRGILIGSLLLTRQVSLRLARLGLGDDSSSAGGGGGVTHWASTVREEAEDGTPCAGAAEDAPPAGETGGDGCAWPWELVRWSRHLKDPAWVGGAHTHLPPPPWLWLWPWLPEDAEEKLRRMLRGDDAAAAPVGVVLVLWLWLWGPWNLPSSPVVST